MSAINPRDGSFHELLTDAQGNLPDSWQVTLVEALGALKRPGLICIVQMGFSVMRPSITVPIDDDERVIVLW